MTGLPDFWTSGLLPLPSAFWTSGLPIPPISAYCNDWTSGLLDFRTSFFAFGLPDFWPSGLLAFRTSGLPAFFLCLRTSPFRLLSSHISSTFQRY